LQTAIEALERGLERQVPGIKEKYTEEVVPALMKKFEYKSPMQVPKLEKIVVNVGMGEAIQNGKAIDAAINDIRIITGQQPVINRAKKSVAAFKLREGMQIGIKVTLRGTRMYDFFDRLIGVALPRVRDFRGISAKSFDGRGNYTMGIKEQLIFPEINYDKIDKVRGMDITFVTTAKTDEEAREFLKLMGVPFQAH
jgi:large subunit ribosomal protein L5